MKAKGYGGIIDDDDWEVPSKPLGALARKAMNMATRDDQYDISAFNKANIPHINRCNVVLEVWKRTKSQDVLKWLRQNHRDEFENATKENIFLLRDWFMEKYADWTVEKGKLNYLSASTIPQIIDVSSADNYFYQIDLLRRERDSWTQEHYDDNYYRQNLMEHIADWKRLQPIHQAMEMDNNISFAAGEVGVMKLVDIDRRKLQLAATSSKFLAELTKAAGTKRTELDTRFTMADNSAVMTYEANATVHHGQRPQQSSLGPTESVCGVCFKPGHGASTCRLQQKQPRMQRALSYEDFQNAKAQSRLRTKDGVCFLCKKPGHIKANCPDLPQPGISGGVKRSAYQAEGTEPPAKRVSGPRPSWPPVGTGRPTVAASVERDSDDSGNQKEYQHYLAYAATQEDDWTYGPSVNPDEFVPEDDDGLN